MTASPEKITKLQQAVCELSTEPLSGEERALVQSIQTLSNHLIPQHGIRIYNGAPDGGSVFEPMRLGAS